MCWWIAGVVLAMRDITVEDPHAFLKRREMVCLWIAGDVLAMRDIGVEESEELPQVLHTLVDDAPDAAIGQGAEQPDVLIQAVRDATPALLQLQARCSLLPFYVPTLQLLPLWLCAACSSCNTWFLPRHGSLIGFGWLVDLKPIFLTLLSYVANSRRP